MTTLSFIVCLLWFLNFTRTITNLLALPRLRERGPLAREPLVSIIVPARDEARVIERTVRAYLAQTYSAFELIVVNDRSVDDTGAILRSIDDPRLVVIDGEESPPGWLGKPWALHQGSLRARGELLLFADADVIYTPGALRAAVGHAQESDAAAFALLPHFELHGFWENAAMPQLAFTVFTLVPTWMSNRSRAAALAIGGGTGNLVAREAYDVAGGHTALRDAVVDDVALARLVRRKTGRRTEAVLANDFVSLHMYHGLGEIVRGFTKNAFFIAGRSFVIGIVVVILSAVGNLLPFVTALRGDAFGIASVALIVATRVVLFKAIRYPIWNAILLHPLMVIIWIYIFLRSMWYTGVRRQLLWRGRTFDARAARFGGDR